MKLFKLLKGVECRVFGSPLVEIEGLFHNNNDVVQGGLFFCLNGKTFNGEDFISDAVNRGAVAVVVNREIKNLHGVVQVVVRDTRKTMSKIACNFYDNPAKNLKIIGVTGTNGKTTTTHMIASLINNSGKVAAIIGTNGVFYNNKKIETEMTTPDPIELQKIFRKLVDSGVEYVCMEVSAHAIFLNKVDGFVFELMIWTNLTEDHLDFFETMEKYYLAKRKIFTREHTKQALINIDDRYGKRLYESINMTKFTYSINTNADFESSKILYKNFNQEFYFNNQQIKTNFLGKFNISNLTAALAAMSILKINSKNMAEKVLMIKPVPGRFNTIVINKKLFIIDYAHTPDGLENVLTTIKYMAANEKIVCIFGCGGNRETQKRSKMGEISSKYANFTIISSDNPRYESREKIASEIEKGVLNSNYKIILDRREAIKYADEITKEGDIILIAGKGVENYIDENGLKTPYSDFEEVEKLRR